jgi:beta-mannosidase
MDLSGVWAAATGDDTLRREFTAPDFADEGWERMPVPGHWRSTAAFAASDGPVLYRTRFEHDHPPDRTRAWLTLDGVFYQSDVWLDGDYLGNTEGYFFPHTFEITDKLARSGDHTLAVDVACPPQTDRTRKRNLTGVFQHWECLDEDWNPGGLWRPVRIETTGPVRLRDVVVACHEASTEHAVVRFGANLDAAEPHTIELSTRVADAEHLLVQPLATGENHLAWTVVLARPRLWWPRALGEAALVDVEIEVRLHDDGGGPPSDGRRFRTGLRQVRLDDWICHINGERLFLKGTNHGPTRAALGDATVDEIERDVTLAADAGLDLLRVHGHIGRPELYDAADRAGVVIWQDLPLHLGYARGVRSEAERQAEAAVTTHGHHPSIIVWCGHNRPFAVDDGRAETLRTLAAQQLPTWNRSFLDHSIKRTLERADGSRPVIAHSGVLPHPPTFEGTDAHLFAGWHGGDAATVADLLARWPRLARFVGAFGAAAVPEDAGFCDPERWPALDWDRLARRHGLQRERFERYVPPGSYVTFDSWRAATQRYQADIVKRYVETLRRLKYRPTGGFAHYLLADAAPAVTCAVVGHDRQPKPAYAALAEACRPVIVVADWPPGRVRPGERLSLDVHVVSDERNPFTGTTVIARLHWAGGDRVWRWQGDVPADNCTWIGTIDAEVPAVDGELRLELLLYGPVRAANVYRSQIGR